MNFVPPLPSACFVLVTVITDHIDLSVPMNLFLTTALFALFPSFRICLAAGPLVLPNILSAITAGHLAPTQLPNASVTLNPLFNLTSLTAISGVR